MHRTNSRSVCRVAIAMALVFAAANPTAAAMASFAAPVALTADGHAGTAAIGIDAAGRALAVWADAGSFYATHTPGQAWTAPQPLYVQGGFGPFLHMTPGGAATVVSYSTNGYGIYFIDRPAGGAWSQSATITSVPDLATPYGTGARAVIFAGNDRGDQVVVWQHLGPTPIMASRRPAGGAWGPPEPVVSQPTGLGLSLADAAIGPSGDVLVAWETFTTTCSVRHCYSGNFIVYASREGAKAHGWSASATPTPPIGNYAYIVRAAIDGAGRGGLILQAGFLPQTLQVTRQTIAGGAWSPLVTAFDGGTGHSALLVGAGAGTQSRTTSFALLDYGTPFQVDTVDGSLLTNSWKPAAVLSASDTSAPSPSLAFALNQAGGSAAAWVDADDTIRAALRTTSGTAYAPVTVWAGDRCQVTVVIEPCRAPAAIAINRSGATAAIIAQIDATATARILYATTNN